MRPRPPKAKHLGKKPFSNGYFGIMKVNLLELPKEGIKRIEMEASIVFRKAVTQNLPLLAHIEKSKCLWPFCFLGLVVHLRAS